MRDLTAAEKKLYEEKNFEGLLRLMTRSDEGSILFMEFMLTDNDIKAWFSEYFAELGCKFTADPQLEALLKRVFDRSAAKYFEIVDALRDPRVRVLPYTQAARDCLCFVVPTPDGGLTTVRVVIQGRE